MGMSSSQARLLNLTARMHQIEYKAAKLDAQKLQMANESTKVYQDYLNALDATKIQYSTLASDGSITYLDATYNSLRAAGYTIKFADEGLTIIDDDTYANYKTAQSSSNAQQYFYALETGRGTVTSKGLQVEDSDGTTWYEIYTAEQLMNMSSSGNYRLMSDIDLSNVSTSNAYYISTFKGTLDGNGYTISGLSAALFNSVSGAEIYNLGLDADITTSSQYCGVLANTATGTNTISNVAVSGSINSTASTAYVGGLIGYTKSGTTTISDVSSSVDITCSGTNVYAGGVFGYITGSSTVTISDSTYSGSLESTAKSGTSNSLGGIVGLINTTGTATIENCSTSGTISNACESNNSWYGSGGIVGTIFQGTNTISYCESSMNISGGTIAGGIAGYAASTTFSYCYYYGSVTKAIYMGGICGEANESSITECYADITGDSSTSNTIDDTAYSCTYGTILGCTRAGNKGNCTITNSSGTFYDTSDSSTSTTEIGADCADTSTSNDSNSASSTSSSYCTAAGASLTTETTVSNGDSVNMSGYTASALWAIMNGGTRGEDWIDESSNTEGEYREILENHADDASVFATMLAGGYIYIGTTDDDGNFVQTSVATDTGLQEVSDETALKKAEAQYEADMKKIDLKDTKYDTDLAAIETEREAIESEIDTLKTVASDNVERTFKLFS